MATYSVLTARNNLSRLLGDARSGNEVIITNRGEPVAKLVPVSSPQTAATGAAIAQWLESHRLPDRLVRPSAEIDAQIAEAADSWE